MRAISPSFCPEVPSLSAAFEREITGQNAPWRSKRSAPAHRCCEEELPCRASNEMPSRRAAPDREAPRVHVEVPASNASRFLAALECCPGKVEHEKQGPCHGRAVVRCSEFALLLAVARGRSLP
eukprot:Polyplicarium_translucidae@DN1907_c0_g1_i2.p3